MRGSACEQAPIGRAAGAFEFQRRSVCGAVGRPCRLGGFIKGVVSPAGFFLSMGRAKPGHPPTPLSKEETGGNFSNAGLFVVCFLPFRLPEEEAGDRWITGGVSVDQSQKGGSVDQFL